MHYPGKILNLLSVSQYVLQGLSCLSEDDNQQQDWQLIVLLIRLDRQVVCLVQCEVSLLNDCLHIST